MYTSALALFIDCALYLKIRQSCFVLCAEHGLCEANRASQPQFKSVSYPPGRPPPLTSLTFRNKNTCKSSTSGYQDIQAQPSPLLPPTCIHLFSSAGHFFSPLFVCFKIVPKVRFCFFEETVVDDETGVTL